MTFETVAGKIPGIRIIIRKANALSERLQKIEYENLLLAEQNIDLRLALKKGNKEKINIVFVCHRPSVWGSLKSVYEALSADDLFSVRIIAIPNKKQLKKLGLMHEIYETEGAEDFWLKDNCINGYDYSTGEWLDIRTLKPDYVFFQQPYNITKPKIYSSSFVSKYAKIAYVAYFSPISIDDTYEESTPLDYLKDLSFFFTQHDDDHEFILNRYKKIPMNICKIVQTGCPRFDLISQYKDVFCDIWNNTNSYKILWTPRWTTNEGNCHFFDYKDDIISYCRNNKNVELTFRPHPQAFLEWAATGEMDEDAQIVFRKQFEQSNLHLDESKDYYPLLYSSDCLITDRSTLIVDYYCTGKPIIYCTSNGKHDSVISGLEGGLYKAGSWQEIETMLNALRSGSDPLKQKRRKILTDYLQIEGLNIGEKIKDVIKSDALK